MLAPVCMFPGCCDMILGKVSSHQRNVPGTGDTLSSVLVKVFSASQYPLPVQPGPGLLTPITQWSHLHFIKLRTPGQKIRTYLNNKAVLN